jgi:hypothetical protein
MEMNIPGNPKSPSDPGTNRFGNGKMETFGKRVRYGRRTLKRYRNMGMLRETALDLRKIALSGFVFVTQWQRGGHCPVPAHRVYPHDLKANRKHGFSTLLAN